MVNICILAFFGDSDLLARGFVSTSDIIEHAFLPAGLFARILGKLIGWSQDTSSFNNTSSMDLSIGAATLWFGRQAFRVVEFREERHILMEIEGLNPCAVQKKVMELAENAVKECMPMLQCQCLLPYKDEGFVALSELVKSVKDSHPLPLSAGRSLSIADATARYRRFLPGTDQQNEYDVFLSYRWDDYTKDFTSKVSDSMTTRCVGEQKRPVYVFLDRERLRNGENFKTQFANSLLSSSVVVPVFSIKAIDDLKWHDPSIGAYDPNWEDNVLIEWILALEGARSYKSGSSSSRVEKIFPIFMGEKMKGSLTGAVDDIIDDHKDLFANIPKFIPSATIRRAHGFLADRDIVPRDALLTMTVYDIVTELRELLGFKLKDAPDPSQYVSESSRKIFEVVNKATGIEDLTVFVPEVPDEPEEPPPAAPLGTVEWQGNTDICGYCHIAFSVFVWRHHCRACGKCVCDSCSRKRIVLDGGSQRVCDSCFLQHHQQQHQQQQKGLTGGGGGKKKV
jgi:hypothetical protein